MSLSLSDKMYNFVEKERGRLSRSSFFTMLIEDSYRLQRKQWSDTK